MTHGATKEATLELMKGTSQRPITELDTILQPDNIISRSQATMRLATTVSEALPELLIIAREYDIDLNTAKGWKEGVRIMDAKNLSR